MILAWASPFKDHVSLYVFMHNCTILLTIQSLEFIYAIILGPLKGLTHGLIIIVSCDRILTV